MTEAIHYESQAEVIESPSAIERLLVGLKVEQGPITVRIDGCKKSLVSQILAVDPSHHQLSIDAFSHEQLVGCLFGVNLSITGWSHGARVQFRAAILPDSRLDGEQILLPFPQRISFFQRRQDYRVETNWEAHKHQPYKVVVSCTVGQQVTGRLNNISAGGLDFYLRRCSEAIVPQQTIECCEIHLYEQVITHAIEVRRVSSLTKDIQRIHARFVVKDLQDKQALTRSVRAFERHLISAQRQEMP